MAASAYKTLKIIASWHGGISGMPYEYQRKHHGMASA